MLRHELMVLGHVVRTHGISGALLIRTEYSNELTTEETVFVDLQGPVPFFIESVKRGSGGWIVQFEWINDLDQAESLVGNEILIERVEDQVDSEYPMIGYTIRDQNSGRKGEVFDVKPLDHHPLLIAQFDNKEVIIPFVEAMIVEVDDDNKFIEMNLPDGLLDL